MPDHREAAAAFQAAMGGELQHEQFSSSVQLRPDAPHIRVATNCYGTVWYITVGGATEDLTRAVWRLVEEERAKATVVQ